MDIKSFSVSIGDKEVTLEVGRFAQQAEAAVLAKCGGTVVHTTIGLGPESSLPYFPLSVEYMEKLYAGGKIKGSRWVKREGKPSDDSVLTARVIDRSIRPLFPDGFRREVQVINTVLSVDSENNPDMLALLSTTAALEMSSIPFDGPLAGLRVGYVPSDDQFIFNPTYEQQGSSTLDLIVSGKKDAVVMVEAGALEVSEDTMVKALQAAQKELAKSITVIEEMRSQLGKEKLVFEKEELNPELTEKIWKEHKEKIGTAVTAKAHLQDDDTLAKLKEQLIADNEELAEEPFGDIFEKLMKRFAREQTFNDKVRADGRKLDEIRPITCEVDLLPSVHGSAMFKRGATQALTIVTLASPEYAQIIEDMEGEGERHYFHHYNMPPYAFGGTGRMGWPKRREVGHGALGERAIMPMLPTQEDFPYTIRVVTEIMSSNGSTSQAAICGSTMSLMAAGVPLKKPVAGIAMGLMHNPDKNEYLVLSDIQGLEDHIGDMDFKVAGTEDGITAIQMDIKIDGIPMEIMQQALAQAKVGRMHIMGKMMECISEPRQELAKSAPKIESIQIPVDKIGELIGPGGKNIRGLQEDTGAEINVNEEGMVTVASADQDAIDAASKKINNMMMQFESGMEFDGEVTRVEDYGAFVELVPGRDGLLHVSEMSTEFVKDVNEFAKVGDELHVRVVDVDGDRVRLSMLTKEEREKQEKEQKGRGGNRSGGRGRGGSRGGGRRGGSRGGRR